MATPLHLLRPTARLATRTPRTSPSPSTRPLLHRTLGLGLGASIFTLSTLTPRPSNSLLRCDAAASPTARLSSTAHREYAQYEKNANTPITTGGRLNAKAVRQISAGSILGLVGGLAVSVFSKPLALLIGLLVFGVQVCFPFFFLFFWLGSGLWGGAVFVAAQVAGVWQCTM